MYLYIGQSFGRTNNKTKPNFAQKYKPN